MRQTVLFRVISARKHVKGQPFYGCLTLHNEIWKKIKRKINFANKDWTNIKTRAAIDGTPSQIPAFLPITFNLGSRSHKMKLSTFYIMWPMHLWSLKFICPMVKEGQEEMHLQENTLYDLDLVVKVTQNVVQCPPNHMTYAPAKFEVATSNSLGEDGFTRK